MPQTLKPTTIALWILKSLAVTGVAWGITRLISSHIGVPEFVAMFVVIFARCVGDRYGYSIERGRTQARVGVAVAAFMLYAVTDLGATLLLS